MKYLIAGLGNIGSEYETTRHNIGFLVLDRLIDRLKSEDFVIKKYASTALIKHKGRSIHLIKPTTYMNNSGKALNYWMQELKVDKNNILVVTDDIALPFGKLRMRKKGSAGGHNGLGNIEEHLGDANYSRLRIGIDNRFYQGKQVEYVLSPFSKEEFSHLVEVLDKAGDAIISFCTLGIDRAMTLHNG